jgi:hypothetical protein
VHLLRDGGHIDGQGMKNYATINGPNKEAKIEASGKDFREALHYKINSMNCLELNQGLTSLVKS